MIVPSIDIMNGQAVQLIGGKEKAIDAGDPLPIAENFSTVGEIAVIDLDAALSTGNNSQIIDKLLKIARCRVGGGIRDLQTAIKWLDAGAEKIIIGTKANPELLSQLPKERVIAALDAVNGEVVVEGWQTATGRGILERIAELNEFVSGYLITFVEREGRLQGTNIDAVAELVKAAGNCKVTIAGGVTLAEEIAQLDRLGADAQVGMALYSGKISLAEAFAAPMTSDREDGLWPTVVVDELGVALGLAWSNLESLSEALKSKSGVYHSRTRGLWRKGETSGARQDLLRVDLDCDRDTIRFTVRQHQTNSNPGFCHLHTYSCWGKSSGLNALMQTLGERQLTAPAGSYSKRLFEDSELLASKLVEEAGELSAAKTPSDICSEATDLIYFTSVAMARAGVRLADIYQELDRRSRRITRRPGDAKK